MESVHENQKEIVSDSRGHPDYNLDYICVLPIGDSHGVFPLQSSSNGWQPYIPPSSGWARRKTLKTTKRFCRFITPTNHWPKVMLLPWMTVGAPRLSAVLPSSSTSRTLFPRNAAVSGKLNFGKKWDGGRKKISTYLYQAI